MIRIAVVEDEEIYVTMLQCLNMVSHCGKSGFILRMRLLESLQS